MSTRISRPFRRCLTPDVDILDACWVTELTDIAGLPANIQSHSIDLYVAGKDDGPNSQSLAVARDAIESLDDHLRQMALCTRVSDPVWEFENIWVPYQTAELFYLGYCSYYGSPIHFAIKLKDCVYGPAGIISENDDSVAAVPGWVKEVLTELTSEELPPAGADLLTRIQERICNEEIMGPEVLRPLLEIVERHGDSIHGRDHYLERLQRLIHHGCRAVTIDSEQVAFEAALDENPADWDLRLVYADWLEENDASCQCPMCDGRGVLPNRGDIFETGDGGSNRIWGVPCLGCGGSRSVSGKVLADGQRWMVENKKRPHIVDGEPPTASWGLENSSSFETDEMASLSIDLLNRLMERFATRRSAEVELAMVLCEKAKFDRQ